MKTKTAYIAAAKWSWGEIDFRVLDYKPSSDSSVTHVVVSEIEVAIPDLDQAELEKLIAGAELQALIDEKEKINAETFRRLAQIDERIGQLQALEDHSC